MPTERAEYEVAAKFTGEGELRRGAAEFDRLADKSQAAVSNTTATGPMAAAGTAWRNLALGVGVAGAAYVAASRAAAQAYAVLREGAQLQTTTERFEKLAASINTTADTMLGKLREATKGMIADNELMASASQIVSLRLAENEDQVVRLATVVGTLGWDMQQVILTFANLSTMRLDALGLSVDEVKAKQKELEEQGLSTAAAFKEAVIQAGEARLEVGGVSDAEQSFKRAEAAVTNYKNAVLESITTTLEQAGAFTALQAAAEGLTTFTNFTSQIEELYESGRLTKEQYNELNAIIRHMGIEAAEAALKEMALANVQTDIQAAFNNTDEALAANAAMINSWAVNAAVKAQWAAEEVIRANTAIFNSLMGFGEVEAPDAWFGGSQGFDYQAAGAEAAKDYQRGKAMAERQARIDRNTTYVGTGQGADWWAAGAETRREMEYAEEAVYSYSGALGGLSTAEQEAAEAHQSFMAAFNQELRAKPEEGLYDAAGVANVEAVNKALYEQVEAAGASAATLAVLGVATGQFTQEQAEAALKAAVLQERIKAIAEEVAAGHLGIGEALGQLGQVRSALDAADLQAVGGADGDVTIAVAADTTVAENDLDATQSQLDALTDEEYMATVGMNIQEVIDGTTEAKTLINSIPTGRTMTIRWEQAGADVIAALRALGIMV